ncbi:MAG: 50S ribosomal protein L37ae [Promethearchaeati archaeon SRVP18_Atabeyarchaeia-1]
MGRTKKAGTTGRFGSRYGATVRKRVKEIEKEQKSYHKCPNCETRALRRVAVGIWQCKKCNMTFAGGAWKPFPMEKLRRGTTKA